MSHPKQLICKKGLTKLLKYSLQHIARLEKAGLPAQHRCRVLTFPETIAAGPEPDRVVAVLGGGMEPGMHGQARCERFYYGSWNTLPDGIWKVVG